ncbi:pimeloyl-ACP methyl ester carboxylesterase [Pseudonocardia sediminis]|uniref:Pimeloyl-ACP methyl ester carboxylesterase n=1 Tax=Pseudonocardia sediminis TaxID=1397368 RepID=A0A4Q7US95_PSEST|nr:alpha/beta fold hydrolase [Pseudonocardia sediminis]RZT83834.1 pimeloyl-ACP methyl ester carboxylesterase [Pseudonocardia sediminis]
MTATTQGAYAAVNGLQMYYEVHGTGRPLVLLHGGVLTFDLSFAAILPALAERRQVIGVELQGHGHTADIDRPLQLDLLASDVVALLDHLGIERADVFGFSLGGLVATEVAVRYPERVGRLVLAAVHFRPDGYHPEIQDPAQDSPRLPTADDFEQMQAAYAAVAPDPEGFFPFLEKAQPLVSDFRGWSDDELRSITGPVLLVIGDTDFVRIEHAAEIHALLPDARLAVLPGCTHMEVVRRPDLMTVVEPFLARGGAG